MWTVLLLFFSNVFMTFAWYGHLKYSENTSLKWAIAISWGIAFFEYCLQVPGNRIGKEHYGWSTAQLKIMQEAITVVVFLGFVTLFMKERLKWSDFVGLGLVVSGVVVTMAYSGGNEPKPAEPTDMTAEATIGTTERRG
jgi:uncharacterized protein (DUF486 family)